MDNPFSSSRGVLALALVALAVVAVGYVSFARGTFSGKPADKVLYWCRDCKAVFPASEFSAKGPGGWKHPEGEPWSNFSCPICTKGVAHPSTTCPKCATKYITGVTSKNFCPTCHPEEVKEAEKKKIPLTPDELKK